MAIITVTDNFENDYSGGTGPWIGNWNEEENEFSDDPHADDIQVVDNPLAGTNHALLLQDNATDIPSPNDYIERQVNLSGATSATLTFDYLRQDSEAGDQWFVQASVNGGAFVTVFTIPGAANDSAYVHTANINISAYIGSNTIIRFVSPDALDGNDKVYIDNVNIVASSAPTAAVDITAIADDTGTAGDFTTSDTLLTVSGTHGPLGTGEKVQVSSNGGSTWSDVTTSTATTWSFTDPTAHPANFTYQARVVDTAGNVGNTDSQAIVIDTSAPTAAVDITAIADDTGTPGDFTTSDTLLTVSGTHGPLGTGEKVQVSSNGGSTWSDVTTSTATTWSFTDPTAHPANFTYQARVVDTAGNVGNTDSQAIVIDTSAPTAAVDITAIADDTGTPGDFTTSDTLLTVSGTHGPLGTGEKVQVSSNGGSTWSDVTTSTATTWSFTDPTAHPANFTYQARVVDTAGNVGNTDSQAIVIDTSAPTAAVDITAIADDTGTPGDFTTSDTLLTVSGTHGPLGTGEKVQVSSNGGSTWSDVTTSTATTWSFTDPTAHPANFTYQARVVDTAGNVGNTDSQAIVIDTSAPTAAVDITAIADDTGTPGDFTTSDTLLTVSGTHGPLGTGEKVQVSSNGGSTWSDVTTSTATTWSFTDPTAHPANFTYQARVVDTAGNVGNTDSQAIVIDTSAPTAAVDITAIADDTGTPGDFTTSDTNLIVSGTNELLGAGEKIQVSSDGGTTWSDVTPTSTTTWSFDDTATTHNSNFVYEARVIDAAANVGDTDDQLVILDINAPTQVPTIVTITDNVDPVTGIVLHTGSTNDTAPALAGTLSAGLALDEVLSIFRDGVKIGEASVAGTDWTFPDSALVDGSSYAYTAKVEDGNGNLGPVSNTYAITIDTTAPTTIALAITAIDEDTETPGDFTTSDTLLTVSGTNDALGAGEKIQVSNDGGNSWSDVTPTTATTWSFTDPTIHGSPFTYHARVIDGAGNVGTIADQAVIIVPPSVPDFSNAGPVVPGGVVLSVAENSTAAGIPPATDADGDLLTYSILDGGDGALFTIDPATNLLSFKSAPDFEEPADANHDNRYEVLVRVSDGAETADQTVTVAVTNVLGVVIKGNARPNRVDATHSATNQPLPTGEEDIIRGKAGNDKLSGAGGNDIINGGIGNDRLKGEAGHDRLNGGAGDDKLKGGDGNDVLNGRLGNDLLKGENGDDSLRGGGGDDVLIGGAGKDNFVFNYKLDAATNVDVVKQFSVADDTIVVDNAVFTQAGGAGALEADFFHVGAAAADNNDYFVYNQQTGALSYDADGNGNNTAVLFAVLTPHSALTNADFLVI